MRTMTERGQRRLALALVAALFVGWVLNFFYAMPPGSDCVAGVGPGTPDCGVVVRDRP